MSLLLLPVYLQTDLDSVSFFIPCFTLTGSGIVPYMLASCCCETVFRKSDVTHDDETTAGQGVVMLLGYSCTQWSKEKYY